MNEEIPKIIITGNNLSLKPSLKQWVSDKAQKLFEHEQRIIRLRMEVGHSATARRDAQCWARGHIEIRGNDLIVTDNADDLNKAIDQVIEKLDRQLRRRSRLSRIKRKQTQAVDIPAALPKVAASV